MRAAERLGDEKYLLKNEWTKKYMKMARAYLGAKALEKAASTTNWKEVWSAGQGVGFIEDILPAAEVVARLAREYEAACGKLAR
jgi:nitronate monooxygenase